MYDLEYEEVRNQIQDEVTETYTMKMEMNIPKAMKNLTSTRNSLLNPS